MNNSSFIHDFFVISTLPRLFSQGNQDQIIRHIINNIDIGNDKYCIEIGYDSNTLTGGGGANTTDLIQNYGWDSLLLDGSFENSSINLYKHFLTPENICSIFEQYNVPVNFGYLSLDIDSTDLWVLDKILDKYKPKFYSVEYNLNIPMEYAITFPNDPSETWQGDKCFGASLKCFDILSKKYGYSFVFAMNFNKTGGHDAFFIRNDLIQNVNAPKIEDFSYVVSSLHNNCISGRHELMLDYEVFLKTNDVKISQKAALDVTKQYIAN